MAEDALLVGEDGAEGEDDMARMWNEDVVTLAYLGKKNPNNLCLKW